MPTPIRRVVTGHDANHAWSNRTGELARVAFVLIDTHPIQADI